MKTLSLEAVAYLNGFEPLEADHYHEEVENIDLRAAEAGFGDESFGFDGRESFRDYRSNFHYEFATSYLKFVPSFA